MDLLFPVLVIFTFFFGSFLVLTWHVRNTSRRRKLPQREVWQQANPEGKCPRCGKTEQRDTGLDDSQDSKRIVACAGCGRELCQFVRQDV